MAAPLKALTYTKYFSRWTLPTDGGRHKLTSWYLTRRSICGGDGCLWCWELGLCWLNKQVMIQKPHPCASSCNTRPWQRRIRISAIRNSWQARWLWKIHGIGQGEPGCPFWCELIIRTWIIYQTAECQPLVQHAGLFSSSISISVITSQTLFWQFRKGDSLAGGPGSIIHLFFLVLLPCSAR